MRAAAFAKNGSKAAVAAGRTVEILPVGKKQVALRLNNKKSVRRLDFVRGDSLLAAVDDDGVTLWDLKSRKETRIKAAKANSAAVSPDGSVVVTAQSRGKMYTWDATTGERTGSLSGTKSSALAMTFTAEGSWLITGHDNGEVIIWDTSTWKIIDRYPGETSVAAIAVLEEGVKVAAAYTDSYVRVFSSN